MNNVEQLNAEVALLRSMLSVVIKEQEGDRIYKAIEGVLLWGDFYLNATQYSESAHAFARSIP